MSRKPASSDRGLAKVLGGRRTADQERSRTAIKDKSSASVGERVFRSPSTSTTRKTVAERISESRKVVSLANRSRKGSDAVVSSRVSVADRHRSERISGVKSKIDSHREHREGSRIAVKETRDLRSGSRSGLHTRREPRTARESIDRVIMERKSVSVSKRTENININGNNNIIVKGNYYESKDYKPARHYSHFSGFDHRHSHEHGHGYFCGNIHYISSNTWCNCGRFHVLRWSNRSCSRVVYFRHGLRFGYSYIYPHYHRKYLFVSIGGYWPHHYRYRRYYWYGCHPNYWYGDYPQYYPSVDNSVTNNYYYASNDDNASYEVSDTADYNTPYGPIPHYDYSDVRAKIAAENALAEIQNSDDSPSEQTLADVFFENAVEAFSVGNYQIAIEAINKAIALAPDDEILPFTLTQALFANGQYDQAVVVLRGVFEKMPRDRETLFYPRGLYPDQKALDLQIAALSKQVDENPFNSDLNLLMAYHMLGTGELDKVKGPLEQAALDEENSVSIAIMRDLLDDARKNKELQVDNTI